MRNGHDKFASPLADKCHLRHDLFLEVPRENQEVIRFCFGNGFHGVDGDMRSRQEMSLFVRASIDCEREKLGTDAAEVEESISFRRSSIANHFFSLFFAIEEEV